jgi:hypothetical protein
MTTDQAIDHLDTLAALRAENKRLQRQVIAGQSALVAVMIAAFFKRDPGVIFELAANGGDEIREAR